MNFKWMRIGLPILVLVALGLVLAKGLQYDPRTLPSVKIGKPAPAFTIPLLGKENATFSSADMRGQVWVLNVFASWCTACVAEHPSLLKLMQEHQVNLVGLAYKDAPVDTQQWLEQRGNPYKQVALDVDGNVGIDFGVYGVPETYVIDAEGVIRFRQVGPIAADFYEVHVAPVLAEKKLPEQSSAFGANAALNQGNQAASVSNINPTAAMLSQDVIDARIKKLADELRCLVCQNQTIADSTAALAQDLKRQITEQIRAGKTDEQIKDYMLERYGEFVLYDPPFNAKNALLWSLPFVLMLVGFVVAWRTYQANKKANEGKGGGNLPRAVNSKRLKELESKYQSSGER
ncbi:MAG: DsbE family thiol:disulfide interchange protein [Candidatus Methylopumilus sp.]|jgi:cytochrome c biogenesis protein CcmG/thiol:disulfide interchange protein DsbE